MRLKTVKVQHYKSLDDVTVHLHPEVTLIVGPNGVGKSNFVDGLRFLRDAVTDDLDDAIRQREGIVRLLQKYKTKPYQIWFGFSFADKHSQASYGLQIKGRGSGDWSITRESFTHEKIADESSATEPLTLNDQLPFQRDAHGRLTLGTSELEYTLPESTLGLGAVLRLTTEPSAVTPASSKPGVVERIWLGAPIVEQVARWGYCTIYPNTLKKPAQLDRDRNLKESGENWASVIKRSKKNTLDKVYEAMRAVLPSFQSVQVATVGSYLVPQFRFQASGDTVLFDPVQLSDGTLRLFGILLAAYQSPRPSLLVIEEPEQTIYPGALMVLADVFKEISRTTQVIITTHSPHLVSHFEPEQIRVANLREGLTHIHPIHPHQIEAVHEGLLSLEEFMATEGLRPADTQLIS